jgi:hypothetical protein
VVLKVQLLLASDGWTSADNTDVFPVFAMDYDQNSAVGRKSKQYKAIFAF